MISPTGRKTKNVSGHMIVYNINCPEKICCFISVKTKRVKFEVVQEVQLDYIPPHLIQIKASKEELERRITKFIERKREDINAQNKLEFFSW